jgi:hypothetical protein
MYPGLFAKAMSTITDMSKANYFYIIAFPEYSGYRVEQDPVFTAYIAATSSSTPSTPTGGAGIIIVAIVVIAVIVVAAFLITRRKPADRQDKNPT